MTPLAEKIAQTVDACIESPEGHATWRDILELEEWKILVSYTGREREKFTIVVKRRDQL
jgi:hypothetical protein